MPLAMPHIYICVCIDNIKFSEPPLIGDSAGRRAADKPFPETTPAG